MTEKRVYNAPHPSITCIVAADKNGGIGINGKIPWDFPEDLNFFRHITLNHPIIMGRGTYESIGKRLPHRTNIVVSHHDLDLPDDVYGQKSLDDALKTAIDIHGFCETIVIGGADIFRQMLPYTTCFYLTRIYESFPADTFLPIIDWHEWTVTWADTFKTHKRMRLDRIKNTQYLSFRSK